MANASNKKKQAGKQTRSVACGLDADAKSEHERSYLAAEHAAQSAVSSKSVA